MHHRGENLSERLPPGGQSRLDGWCPDFALEFDYVLSKLRLNSSVRLSDLITICLEIHIPVDSNKEPQGWESGWNFSLTRRNLRPFTNIGDFYLTVVLSFQLVPVGTNFALSIF